MLTVTAALPIGDVGDLSMPIQGREIEQLPVSHWIEVAREALDTLDNRLGRSNLELSASQFRSKLEKAIAFIQAIGAHGSQSKGEQKERDEEEER